MPGSLRVCVITPFGGISIGLYASWMLRFFPVLHSFFSCLVLSCSSYLSRGDINLYPYDAEEFG